MKTTALRFTLATPFLAVLAAAALFILVFEAVAEWAYGLVDALTPELT